MGRYRSCFLPILLLIAALLSVSVSQGSGRKLMEAAEHVASSSQLEETGRSWRMMIEVMDYSDPGPNVNPRTGITMSPPPPPSQG
ncbi:hypothetical protein SAY87_010309 [Trapa incisa]|uniref:Uncharacterized protein n=1 Tax=Trapa incisa TaxID=236973 RepID=A0AAN7GW49_9MYRT|nr:hypothetical protein SAY87_010309 [Trapa incisa]